MYAMNKFILLFLGIIIGVAGASAASTSDELLDNIAAAAIMANDILAAIGRKGWKGFGDTRRETKDKESHSAESKPVAAPATTTTLKVW